MHLSASRVKKQDSHNTNDTWCRCCCICRLSARVCSNACSSEGRLLRVYQMVPTPLEAEDPCGTLDNVSAEILRKFHGAILETYAPLAVIGDGNCLYRAAALAMFGTQELHLYLRLCTAMELIANQRHYDVSTDEAHPDISALQASPFDSILHDALTPGAYAELVHIYALSAALGVVIESYMPSPLPASLNPYNRMVVGRGVRDTQAPRFRLMWTMTSVPRYLADFRPNHFVYLATENQCVPIDSEEEQDTSTTQFPQTADSDDDSVPATTVSNR